jgi:hypothetical protein
VLENCRGLSLSFLLFGVPASEEERRLLEEYEAANDKVTRDAKPT